MGLSMVQPICPRHWHANPNLPDQPTASTPSADLFNDAGARARYWLPEPPGANLPELQTFWSRLSSGITEYRRAAVRNGPRNDRLFLANPLAGPVRFDDWARLNGTGRQSRSPNWSGTTIRAVDGSVLTQVVGAWQEPDVARSGSFQVSQEFRSSVWIGFNGHAAYYDSALPQIGTMQRIKHTKVAGWKTSHWVWFEWWANTKAVDIATNLLPIYLKLDVQPGDAVLCSVELIPGDSIRDHGCTYPFVARMCVCVEHIDTTVNPSVQKKMLVTPFIVFPPKVDGYQVRTLGSTANWIAECPFNVDRDNPFLMPQFVSSNLALNPLSFGHCVAAVAPDLGEPILSEKALGVSRRINMFSRQLDAADGLTKIATTQPAGPGNSTFDIEVSGNQM